MNTIQSIVINPFFAIISFFVALLGIILTIIFYIKSVKRKIPKFEMRSNNLVTDFINLYDDLKIKFNGMDTANLTVTKIAFWNAGKETINNADIATSDLIKILIKDDYKIINAKVIKVVNESNRFSVSKQANHNYVKIDFEYLDKDEGGIIQIVHTGKSSSDISISGTIKGFGQLLRGHVMLPFFVNWIRAAYEMKDKVFLLLLKFLNKGDEDIQCAKEYYKKRIIGIMMLILPLAMVMSLFIPIEPQKISFFGRIVMVLVVFIFYYPMGFFLLSRKTPKKLEIY